MTVTETVVPDWEGLSTVMTDIIERVNNVLDDGSVMHGEIIRALTFIVMGSNKIIDDLMHEGSRMKPPRNFVSELVTAQAEALEVMRRLDWRRP